MTSKSRRIALLIDGDNAQPSLMGPILAATEKHGIVTVRRIYGNWTTPSVSRWKDSLQSHAAQPVQQFPNATGKNATDIALVIEAMDLLHTGAVGGFCIVSSDSDYTRLAMRIREQGLFVMGVGRSDTPKAFVNACNVFVSTESLSSQGGGGAKVKEASPPVQNKSAPQKTQKASRPDWADIVGSAVKKTAAKDGWADMAAVGSNLPPGFKLSSHGHNKLSLLIKSRPDLFETKNADSTIKTRVKS